MKAKDFWTRIEEFIFFTTPQTGWGKKWDVLMFNGDPVTDMEFAKKVVREHGMGGQTVGLAEFDQMKVNNAQWDNL